MSAKSQLKHKVVCKNLQDLLKVNNQINLSSQRKCINSQLPKKVFQETQSQQTSLLSYQLKDSIKKTNNRSISIKNTPIKQYMLNSNNKSNIVSEQQNIQHHDIILSGQRNSNNKKQKFNTSLSKHSLKSKQKINICDISDFEYANQNKIISSNKKSSQSSHTAQQFYSKPKIIVKQDLNNLINKRNSKQKAQKSQKPSKSKSKPKQNSSYLTKKSFNHTKSLYWNQLDVILTQLQDFLREIREKCLGDESMFAVKNIETYPIQYPSYEKSIDKIGQISNQFKNKVMEVLANGEYEVKEEKYNSNQHINDNRYNQLQLQLQKQSLLKSSKSKKQITAVSTISSKSSSTAFHSANSTITNHKDTTTTNHIPFSNQQLIKIEEFMQRQNTINSTIYSHHDDQQSYLPTETDTQLLSMLVYKNKVAANSKKRKYSNSNNNNNNNNSNNNNNNNLNSKNQDNTYRDNRDNNYNFPTTSSRSGRKSSRDYQKDKQSVLCEGEYSFRKNKELGGRNDLNGKIISNSTEKSPFHPYKTSQNIQTVNNIYYCSNSNSKKKQKPTQHFLTQKTQKSQSLISYSSSSAHKKSQKQKQKQNLSSSSCSKQVNYQNPNQKRQKSIYELVLEQNEIKKKSKAMTMTMNMNMENGTGNCTNQLAALMVSR